MYEHYRQPLLPLKAFYRRMLRSLGFSLLLLIGTLFIGSAGFRFIEKFSWVDSVLNCVMIMTGVGTVGTVSTTPGKVFTGIYSILSTLIFFTMVAIIFTPLLHRLLHKFHLDVEKKS